MAVERRSSKQCRTALSLPHFAVWLLRGCLRCQWSCSSGVGVDVARRGPGQAPYPWCK
ncbi:putative cell division control protein 3-like [Alternaria alternata]|nr:putative cell division control protein 3-like [Alternaria alternata]